MDRETRQFGRGSTTPTIELLGLVQRITALEKEVERLHAVEGPVSRVGFAVWTSVGMANIAPGADLTVPFDTEVFDLDSNYNPATYTFTAPLAGHYLFIVRLCLQDVDSAATYVRISLTTTTTFYPSYFPVNKLTGDDDYLTMEVCSIALMSAADTAIATVRQLGGAAQMDVTVAGSWFMGWLLG